MHTIRPITRHPNPFTLRVRHQLALISMVLLLLLTGCVGRSAALAAGGNLPTAEPILVTPIVSPNGYTLAVVGYCPAARLTFKDETEPVDPPVGYTYHVVVVLIESTVGFSAPLSLDDVLLITADGKKFAAARMTWGPYNHETIDSLTYFPRVGMDGRTLDFGVGIKKEDMKSTVDYKYNKPYTLAIYHGQSPMHLSFIFTVPVGAKVSSFQFLDLPAITFLSQ